MKGLVRGALYPAAVVCSFALEAPVWQKAAVTAVTLLLTFGIMVLISRRRGRPFAAYRKALCVLLVAVFTFDSVTLGYFGAGGGVKEARAAVPADGIYFYLNDHLGTPLKMVDEDGAVVWSADYLPFGQATVDPASTVESNWRFPGQFWDGESGLHYNVMRSYAQALGRYVRPDPLNVASSQVGAFEIGMVHLFTSSPKSERPHDFFVLSPDRLSLYAYVADNAPNRIDPMGLCVWMPEGPNSTEYGNWEMIYTIPGQEFIEAGIVLTMRVTCVWSKIEKYRQRGHWDCWCKTVHLPTYEREWKETEMARTLGRIYPVGPSHAWMVICDRP